MTLTSKEEELERGTELRGFRHGLQDFWAEFDLPKFRKINDVVEGNPDKHSADNMYMEIYAVVACVSIDGMVSHIQCLLHAAHRAGASPEELFDALMSIRGYIGTVRWFKGVEAWRATFRPDIPSIDRVIELR